MGAHDTGNIKPRVYRATGENATKIYLFGYRSLLRRREALFAALEEYREKATRSTGRLEAIRVSGTTYHSPLENNAIKAVDGEREIEGTIAVVGAAIEERLRLIEGLKDERHKEILTMRYIAGMGWEEIIGKVPYEERHVFRLHGEALEEIRVVRLQKDGSKWQ